jgi:hypothetical protein
MENEVPKSIRDEVIRRTLGKKSPSPVSQYPRRQCTHCSERVSSEFNFCPHCGNPCTINSGNEGKDIREDKQTSYEPVQGKGTGNSLLDPLNRVLQLKETTEEEEIKVSDDFRRSVVEQKDNRMLFSILGAVHKIQH